MLIVLYSYHYIAFVYQACKNIPSIALRITAYPLRVFENCFIYFFYLNCFYYRCCLICVESISCLECFFFLIIKKKSVNPVRFNILYLVSFFISLLDISSTVFHFVNHINVTTLRTIRFLRIITNIKVLKMTTMWCFEFIIILLLLPFYKLLSYHYFGNMWYYLNRIDNILL